MLAAATLAMVATSSRRAKRPEGIWVWTFDLPSENHAWNAGSPCPHRHSGDSRNLTGTPWQPRGFGLRRHDEGADNLTMLEHEFGRCRHHAQQREGNQVHRGSEQDMH